MGRSVSPPECKYPSLSSSSPSQTPDTARDLQLGGLNQYLAGRPRTGYHSASFSSSRLTYILLAFVYPCWLLFVYIIMSCFTDNDSHIYISSSILLCSVFEWVVMRLSPKQTVLSDWPFARLHASLVQSLGLSLSRSLLSLGGSQRQLSKLLLTAILVLLLI